MYKKWMRVLAMIAMIFAVTLGTAGCKEKGAGEKAGEALDDAAHDVKDAAHDLKRDLDHN